VRFVTTIGRDTIAGRHPPPSSGGGIWRSDPSVGRNAMRSQQKAPVWLCGHRYPLEVVSTEDGRRARCLSCGATGPARESPTKAAAALRGDSSGRSA
jgi:hypothetical protein